MNPRNDRQHGRCNRESLAAHARVEPTKTEVWARILAFAIQGGPRGFTCDELTAAWGCSPNHVAPRCTELLASGDLVRTTRRRDTRAGCPAAVLVAKQFATETDRLFADDAPLRHLDLG